MNLPVNKIGLSPNGIVQFYRDLELLDTCGEASDVRIESGKIVVSTSRGDLMFGVHEIITVGTTSYDPISTQTTEGYQQKLYDVYDDLVTNIFVSCCSSFGLSQKTGITFTPSEITKTSNGLIKFKDSAGAVLFAVKELTQIGRSGINIVLSNSWGKTYVDTTKLIKIDTTVYDLIDTSQYANSAAINAKVSAVLEELSNNYFKSCDSGSGGGVSDVTATLPLTSTGGATPNISSQMASGKLIGRYTAGAGVMEEVSVGPGLNLSPLGVLAGTAAFDPYTATLTTDTNNLNASIISNGYLLLTPSTNVKLTGLQGGATGRVITLINTSSSYTILLENNTTSSSAGNRFFNPGGEYLILLPGESLTFTYYNGQWNSEYLAFEQQLELFSDLTGYATGSGNFTNGAYFVDGPWRFLGGGSAPTSNVLPRPVTAQKKGIVTISLSRSPTVLLFYGSPISGLAAGGVADADAGTTRFVNSRFTIGDVAFNAATQHIECTMGIANGGGIGASSFGAYWCCRAEYANWQCVTDSGATATLTDSGLARNISVTSPPAASEYYTLGVVVHRSNGTSVSNAGFFSVDTAGVITWRVREVNTNIPTTACSPTLCWNGQGTLINTTPNIFIDYLGYKIIGGTR